jgi:hypothetical protein
MPKTIAVSILVFVDLALDESGDVSPEMKHHSFILVLWELVLMLMHSALLRFFVFNPCLVELAHDALS